MLVDFEVILKSYSQNFLEKPSILQDLQLFFHGKFLATGVFSSDRKGVVAKIFHAACPRTPNFTRAARTWFQHYPPQRDFWSNGPALYHP